MGACFCKRALKKKSVEKTITKYRSDEEDEKDEKDDFNCPAKFEDYYDKL